MNRNYNTLIVIVNNKYTYILTVEEWNHSKNVGVGIDDGDAYWCKDGFQSSDECWSTPQLDATHVIFYSK